MKRWMLLFGTVLAAALSLAALAPPAAAQEGGGCDIDLAEAIATLVEAQRGADRGDLLTAVRNIEGVVAELEALVELCGDVGVPLEESFTSPDELLSFNYPAGWAILSPEPGIYMMANTQMLLSTVLDDDLDAVPPGGQVVVVAVAPVEDTYRDVTDFESFVAAFQKDGFRSDTPAIGPVSTRPVNRYEAREFRLAGESIDGIVHLLDLGEGTVAGLFGIASSGEVEALEPVYRSIIRTLRYGGSQSLLPPGAPLDSLNYVQAGLIDEFNEDVDVRTAVLAPDGSAVAWVGGSRPGRICLFSFADFETTCTELSPGFEGRPNYLLWSPDSRYIAFGEDFPRAFFEPDIWLLGAADRRVVNVTDDGVAGSVLEARDSNNPAWIDHAFTWGPSGDLYFVRTLLTEDEPEAMPVGLYRLESDVDEPQLIYDLSGVFGYLSIYNSFEYALDGPMAVSPDGAWLALVVREQKSDSPRNGVWLLDLVEADGLEQVAPSTALSLALPPFMMADSPNGAYPIGLGWSAESDQLFVLAGTDPSRGPILMRALYRIDLDSGQLIPYGDFSQVADEDELFAVDETTGYQRVYQMPRTAVMAPDRSAPLIYHWEAGDGRAGLSVATPDGEPELLYEIESHQRVPGMFAAAARDGKVLVQGYLFTPGEE